MDIQTIVGDNIRGHRKKIGWTQEKLSVRAKISSQYISRVELGTENPSVAVLSALSKILGVHISDLFIKESYRK